jgi:hypothetical protein
VPGQERRSAAMPEEPDLTLEDIEILDGNVRKRIEARKQLRQGEAEELDSVGAPILAAVRSRPDSMR